MSVWYLLGLVAGAALIMVVGLIGMLLIIELLKAIFSSLFGKRKRKRGEVVFRGGGDR